MSDKSKVEKLSQIQPIDANWYNIRHYFWRRIVKLERLSKRHIGPNIIGLVKILFVEWKNLILEKRLEFKVWKLHRGDIGPSQMLPDPYQDGVIKILQWNGDNSVLIH
jgi:hypothetical protein